MTMIAGVSTWQSIFSDNASGCCHTYDMYRFKSAWECCKRLNKRENWEALGMAALSALDLDYGTEKLILFKFDWKFVILLIICRFHKKAHK